MEDAGEVGGLEETVVGAGWDDFEEVVESVFDLGVFEGHDEGLRGGGEGEGGEREDGAGGEAHGEDR